MRIIAISMARNIRTHTIALKTWSFGEIHKGVTFITPDLGVVDAIAYGAAKGKGKLSASCALFSFSKTYLYHNPVKGTYKITDIELLNYFEGIRDDLRSYYAASFYCEVLLKTLGAGGDYSTVFHLLKKSFDALNSVKDNDNQLSLLLIQFIWRYMKIAGFQPDITQCSMCGNELEKSAGVTPAPLEHGFFCSLCMAPGEDTLSLGCLKYLRHTAGLSLEKATLVSLTNPGPEKLKNTLLRFMVCLVETPLRTLEKGCI